MMPEILEMPQLVDQHGMTEVQVGSGRVKTSLDPQRTPCFQLFRQFGFDQEFIRTAFDDCQTFFYCFHGLPFTSSSGDDRRRGR